MSGWYIMHRGWMDSFKSEPFTEREAFLWSIEQAAFAPHDQWFKGQRITVQRGQFATSIREMAQAFDWSIKRVRGFMDRMGKAEKWAQQTAHQGAQSPTIITVCNYDEYQSVADAEGTVEGTAKGMRGAQQGHSKGTQQNKENKGKKGKKEDNSPSDSSSGEPDDGLPFAESRAVAVDIVGPAFAAYAALRVEVVPGGRGIDLTPARRNKLALRLAEIGGAEAWGEVLAQIRGSPFLRGDNRTGKFIAEIDWLLKPENLRKVREGNYDDRSSRRPHTDSSGRTNTVDALRHALDVTGLGR